MRLALVAIIAIYSCCFLVRIIPDSEKQLEIPMKARMIGKYGAMAFAVWTVINVALGLAWGIPAGFATWAAMQKVATSPQILALKSPSPRAD